MTTTPIEATWTTAYPRDRGLWTLRGLDGKWGSYDPDTGASTVVDPADDPRLPALRDTLTRGTLVAYRVERRAVVATPNSFMKVVRPKRLAPLVRTHEWLTHECQGVVTPEVVSTSNDGAVELTAIPGTSLHNLLRVHGPQHLPVAVIEEVAAKLAAFHDTPVAGDLSTRGADSATSMINAIATADPSLAGQLAAAASQLPAVPDTPAGLTHGDLHDKNIFHRPRQVGLIDLDGVRRGAAEDDVANLSVHLQLRALQASQPHTTGRRLADCFLDNYLKHRALDHKRVLATTSHTWFRLAAIYSFRNTSRHLVPELLRRATGDVDARAEHALEGTNHEYSKTSASWPISGADVA